MINLIIIYNGVGNLINLILYFNINILIEYTINYKFVIYCSAFQCRVYEKKLKNEILHVFHFSCPVKLSLQLLLLIIIAIITNYAYYFLLKSRLVSTNSSNF